MYTNADRYGEAHKQSLAIHSLLRLQPTACDPMRCGAVGCELVRADGRHRRSTCWYSEYSVYLPAVLPHCRMRSYARLPADAD